MNSKLTGNLNNSVNSKTNGFYWIVIGLALVALLVIPMAFRINGSTASSPAVSGPEPRTIVAVPALAVQASGSTSGLAKVYQAPQVGSRVTSVIAPHTQVQVLARSQDGAYFAIASQTDAAEVAGWVATSEISTTRISATTRSLVKVYGAPDDNSQVTDVLAPSKTVTVIGRSSDGRYFAIAGEGFESRMAGWVARAGLDTGNVEAQAASLVKVYRSPDDSSTVVGVFTPDQKMVLSGQDANGNWYAVSAEDNQGLTGWIASAEIKNSPAAPDLPVIR